jgi:streptogramin lyase
MNNLPIIGGSIVAVTTGIVIAVFTLFPTSTISGEYGIMVDPTKEKQTLFIMARVAIENTGTLPLTNVEVNYGDGDIDYLGTLKPGQYVILSPPQGNSLQYVVVKADGDVYVTKAYREPIAMPGMMGS